MRDIPQTFGLREKEGDHNKVDRVEADEDEIVLPADICDCDVRNLRKENIEQPVGAGRDYEVM